MIKNLLFYSFDSFSLVLLTAFFNNPDFSRDLTIFMIFFIKGKPVFNNGSRPLPRNLPTCAILDSCVLNNIILADELFAKALYKAVKIVYQLIIVYMKINLLIRITNQIC